jgi:hypothetical protein
MTRTSTTVYTTLTGFIVAETEKAILFEVREISGSPVADPVREWFPLSQVSKIVRAPKNAEPGSREAMDWILAAEWLCLKKGLVEE